MPVPGVWSPWSACNIDEGPLATATMEQISEDLLGNWSERNKTDQDLQVSRERGILQGFIRFLSTYKFKRLFIFWHTNSLSFYPKL